MDNAKENNSNDNQFDVIIQKTPPATTPIRCPIQIKAPSAMKDDPIYEPEMDGGNKLSISYMDETNICISISMKGDIVIDWGDQEFWLRVNTPQRLNSKF